MKISIYNLKRVIKEEISQPIFVLGAVSPGIAGKSQVTVTIDLHDDNATKVMCNYMIDELSNLGHRMITSKELRKESSVSCITVFEFNSGKKSDIVDELVTSYEHYGYTVTKVVRSRGPRGIKYMIYGHK